MSIRIPDFALVLMVGPTSSGKSHVAARLFKPTEIVSSDKCRALASDDENDQTATKAAYEILELIVRRRLERRLTTVVDATNLRPEDRARFLAMGKELHAPCAAIVMRTPERLARERAAGRGDRRMPAHVFDRQSRLFRKVGRLEKEGFRFVREIRPEEAEEILLERFPLACDRKELAGPFDLIGDVHGCLRELRSLVAALGGTAEDALAEDGRAFVRLRPAPGRTLAFLGDLVDRGPDSPGVLRSVMEACRAGAAIAVAGNHDVKFARWARGRDVVLSHGLDLTAFQFKAEPEGAKEAAASFVEGLPTHLVLDGGALVAAHAGMRADMIGRDSGAVRSFALYGDPTGAKEEDGAPVRSPWAETYDGKSHVVYGHVPDVDPEWRNLTICVDGGCVYGGALRALRWPEKELVSVQAEAEWCAPTRPLTSAKAEADARRAEDPRTEAEDSGSPLPEIGALMSGGTVETSLDGRVRFGAGEAAAALEAMSRFAVDPRWLAYIPPTMCPTASSALEGFLEHPAEALAYYRKSGVEEIVAEIKHMGSRAVAIVCRTPEAAERTFGIRAGGVVHTRTGRRFFSDPALEEAVLSSLRGGAERSGVWEELDADWMIVDGELMPWSAKADGLLKEVYAPVAAAARMGLPALEEALRMAAARGCAPEGLLDKTRARLEAAEAYSKAYGGYCWKVDGAEGLSYAPFHLMASGGASGGSAHHGKPHSWHLGALDRIVAADRTAGGKEDGGRGILFPTERRFVRLDDDAACAGLCAWWEERTAAGAEGMVVKPAAFTVRGRRGVLQPAVKVRGREYLRIIYGPDYLDPAHLERLKKRSIGAKGARAAKEYALGAEGLDRLAAGKGFAAMHECAFAVLALESEPIDPRL